jgi:N-acetylglucosamine-6-phosphate deacetylase
MEISYRSSGMVDLQINGALGKSFNQLTLADLDFLTKIAKFLWQQGLDGFLPTLVTTSAENTQRSLEVIATYLKQPQPLNAAKILGVHLEGPFLHPDRRGAHPQEHLLPLTLANLQTILGNYSDLVKLITLAPELDSSGQAISYLVDRGIRVSLGHSTASEAIASQAFDLGASMVTHAFNAMPTLHHRQPGILGQALTDDRVWCGAIADGVHLHPKIVEILYRLKGDRLVLVSDALAPIGLAEGNYPWDKREISIGQGTARLPDGTLCGTTLPLVECVQNLVKWQICSLEQAIALVTDSPRQFLGLELVGSGSLNWHYDSNVGITCSRSLNLDGSLEGD